MIAVVPVRKGSQRVPNKNIKKFADSSLLEIKINQLLRVNLFEEIVVTSDCKDMLALAKDLGAETHRRDEKYCRSGTPMREVYSHIAHCFKDHEAIAYINATNPLIQDIAFHKCYNAFRNRSPETVSVNTVHEVKDFLWCDGAPINYDPYNQPRSQDLPQYYALNFACSIIRTDVMLHKGIVVGAPFVGVFIDKIQSLDIDDIHDFEIAETLYKNIFMRGVSDEV